MRSEVGDGETEWAQIQAVGNPTPWFFSMCAVAVPEAKI
jgi:hypothetical protein